MFDLKKLTGVAVPLGSLYSKANPVIGEFSDKSSINSLSGAKSERLDRIVKEARQQSGSPVNTIVEKPMDLQGAI